MTGLEDIFCQDLSGFCWRYLGQELYWMEDFPRYNSSLFYPMGLVDVVIYG